MSAKLYCIPEHKTGKSSEGNFRRLHHVHLLTGRTKEIVAVAVALPGFGWGVGNTFDHRRLALAARLPLIGDRLLSHWIKAYIKPLQQHNCPKRDLLTLSAYEGTDQIAVEIHAKQ